MVDQTQHTILVDNAQLVGERVSDSVDLIVTSPPYPMVEMWDDIFTELNSDIKTHLEDGDRWRSWELMHAELDVVWGGVQSLVDDGGIVCINVGDATRSVDGEFHQYPNAARITQQFVEAGFNPLPRIYWHKPTNSATKYMGSGSLPPNQYPTHEHEYILIFRKGGCREIDSKPDRDRRYESAYFHHERNLWFQDRWDQIGGRQQALAGNETRDRSGAYPLLIPYRLIQMFSLYDDTVLDPFVGTGTTTLAAMISGRNSIGFELDRDVATLITDQVDDLPDQSRTILRNRIKRQQEHIASQQQDGNPPQHESNSYPFSLVSKAEKDIQFYSVTDVTLEKHGWDITYGCESLQFETAHDPFTAAIPTSLHNWSEQI
jgi:DNA modification methylase